MESKTQRFSDRMAELRAQLAASQARVEVLENAIKLAREDLTPLRAYARKHKYTRDQVLDVLSVVNGQLRAALDV